MKIFKWVIDIFRKLAFRLLKKRQEHPISRTLWESRNTSKTDIDQKIKQLIAASDSMQEAEFVEVIQQLTAKDLGIVEGVVIGMPGPTRGKFNLVEVEQEIYNLNRKLLEIGLKESRVDPVYFPHNYPTDKRIEGLEHFSQVHDGKKNLSFEPSAVEKLKSQFGNFDKFLQERVLVRIYRIREDKRRQEEEVKKQQVKELIGRIESLINHGDLQQVKNQIVKATSSISALRNPDQKKFFREKLETLKGKFQERQIREEAKRQAIELRKRQEEVERTRIAEEAKREEERKLRAQQAQIQKQQEEESRRKEEEKKQELQRLLAKKSDWQDFAHVLQIHGITTLYHFTDRANIDYIKRYGGLFSWQYLRKTGIEVPYEGGDSLSKDLDNRYGLGDFVRVCFTENHPMMYVARDQGRIPNPIILKISPEVCEFQNTKFSNMNATRNGHSTGSCLSDLQKIKFDVVKQRTQFELLEQNRPFYQAEVLVKTWIPIDYITNIKDFK